MHIQYCIVLFLVSLASINLIVAFGGYVSATLTRDTADLGRTHVNIKIIGGQTAQRAEFPFAATLFFLSGKEACSASIISKRHLLTAAHCVVDGGNTKRVVYEGNSQLNDNRQNATSPLNATTVATPSSNSTNATLAYDLMNQTTAKINVLQRPEQLYRTRNASPTIIRSHDRVVQLGSTHTTLKNPLKIHHIHVHPSYLRDGALHDIAVIELAKDIVFSDAVQPIRLLDMRVHPGDRVIAVGFGRDASGITSPTLQHLTLETPSDKLCEAGARSHPWHANFICARATRPDTGTCIGDSGGPAVVYHDQNSTNVVGHGFRQVGVDSYHRNVLHESEHHCAKEGTLTFWTRIGAVLEFITKVTKLSADELTGALDSATIAANEANDGHTSSFTEQKGSSSSSSSPPPSNSGKHHGVGRVLNTSKASNKNSNNNNNSNSNSNNNHTNHEKPVFVASSTSIYYSFTVIYQHVLFIWILSMPFIII